MPIEKDTAPMTITASFGVTHIAATSEKILKAAIKRANNGLYEAKETGRNRIIIQEMQWVSDAPLFQ
ncbi:diguanylate cyclase domain-containing protein [Vreelandella sp. V005]|uniref:diguanylate cyclase domain-containing protein n=1 Tax=Vreelandella sp. V005 TaxID=3459608 RepID=UPI004043ECC3